MELNIYNSDAAFNNKVFSGSLEHSIDSEFVLPDYYPEISKILKCRVVPRVSSSTISGQTLSVEGSITVNLIYCSPENEIFGFEQQLSFSKAFELGEDCPDAVVESSTKCEYVNCRAASERKIDVHGAIGIYVSVYKKQSTAIVTDIDCRDVIIKRGLLPATSPVGVGEKALLIEEELELSQGQPSIRCILKCDAKAVNKECRIISGKVVAKGELNVFILYCAEHTSSVQSYRNSIPYSQILDIADLTENCVCSAKTQIAALEIKPRTSATGETRSFMLSSKLNFKASACCEDDLPVVLDAYSTKYNAEVKTKEITVEKLQKSINEKFICKKTLENTGEISSVLDIWCEPNVSEVLVENGQLKICGTLQICILAINSKEVPQYVERPLEFEFESMVDSSNDTLFAKAEVLASNISFALLSGNSLEVSAELSVTADVYSSRKIKLVTNVCIDENNQLTKAGDSALIIYYAQCGESLWDIARRYNSVPEEICEINGISEEILSAAKTLLIPVK